MPIVAEVRSDEAELGCGADAREVVRQVPGESVRKRYPVDRARRAHGYRSERHDVGIALGRVVDDGVKVDEGVVSVGVLVPCLGDLGVVGAVDGWVRAVGATKLDRSPRRPGSGRSPCLPAYSRHDATFVVGLGGWTASSWLAIVCTCVG